MRVEAKTTAILESTGRVVSIKRSLLLYHLLQLIGLPFIFLYFAIRCISDRSYRALFGERLGRLPLAFERTPPNSIWLHAVSVGEVVSAVPLIQQIRSERPNVAIFVSTSTVAGRRAAKQHLTALTSGIFYGPLDSEKIIRSVFKVIRPALLIVFETEIWPDLYYQSKRAGIALALVNARISTRTWPRYRRLRWFFQPILQLADIVFAQSNVDADRYRVLGVPDDRIHIEGNLKYDATPGSAPGSPQGANDADAHAQTTVPREFPTRFGAEQVWVAASTVGPNEPGSLHRHAIDEDDTVIAAFRELSAKYPRLLLVLAPRQPARFDKVAAKLRAAGLPFVRRSAITDGPPLPGILLLDTIGELASWYGVADVAFVGGSLAPRGGHNILEPASQGVPVIVGPHMHNFEAITRDLLDCGALYQIQHESQLLAAVEGLLTDRARAEKMGASGRRLVEANAGVAARITPILWRLYDHTFPRPPRSDAMLTIQGILAHRWMRGAAARRAKAEQICATRAPLPVPVISIGGIAVGGGGKTPLANRLVHRLRADGWTPGILTRGYRRRSTAEAILLGPGASLPPAYTGDEAQIFLRNAEAALGIGANRYETARLLLDRFPATDILVLDDGFQHARMPRDIDIVVVDGIDPWGGDAAIPLGRLREPLEILKKASIIVVTRGDDDPRFAVIQERLRQIAPGVPVFRCRTRALGWREWGTGKRIDAIEIEKTAAFCGLGNPANFWRTLDQLRMDPLFRWSFPDHHHYRLLEIQGLVRSAHAHGADWLLTTEKDCYNLPEAIPGGLHGLRIVWLEIELVMDDEERFFGELSERLEHATLRLR